eukprot:1258241-Pyramimonas_sp.AAC.2
MKHLGHSREEVLHTLREAFVQDGFHEVKVVTRVKDWKLCYDIPYAEDIVVRWRPGGSLHQRNAEQTDSLPITIAQIISVSSVQGELEC